MKPRGRKITTVKGSNGKDIPVQADILKVKTAEVPNLDKKSKQYIDNKLNDCLARQIVSSLGGSEKLKAAVDALQVDYRDVKDADLKSVVLERVLPELQKDPSLEKEFSRIAAEELARGTPRIGDLLHLDKAFQDNPVFMDDARRVKVMELAAAAGLDQDTAGRLADRNLDLGQAADQEWESLVGESVISEAQERNLRLTAELANLTGDHFLLVKALKTGKITSVKDLAALDQKGWLGILKTKKIKPPEGETLEAYAGNIAFNMEKTYPTECFFQRVVIRDRSKEIGLTGVIQPLLAKNGRLFGSRTAGEINWEGIPARDRKAIENSLAQLGALANTYKHLGVADILNDPALKAEEKQKSIAEKIGKMEAFYRDNPDLDLRLADFFEKTSGAGGPGFIKPVWDGISPEDRPMARKQLMAYQRVLNISGGSDAAGVLLAKGFESSFEVAQLAKSQFIKATGLPEETAGAIYARARGRKLRAVHAGEAIRDVFHGNFRDVHAANTDPQLVNQLKEIDGYKDLFGSRNYCDCEHCKSIFSPAAYFVDLMYFIEKNISTVVFSDKPDHPLYLKNRRPDLWNLQLTCENTNTPIQYLEIVNDILEQYLETVWPGYNIYETLSTAGNSFKLPFHLPLEELRLYLSHFGLTLADIFRLLKQEPAAVAREQLRLSAQELDAVVRPDPNGSAARFGSPASIAEMEVQDFLKHTGINRDELDQLAELKFIKGNGNITVETEEKADDMQSFEEKVKGLDKNALDRIHRFIRLWRQLPWTMAELDLVLSSLKEANLASSLSSEAINYIAALAALQNRLKLSVEEMCSLFHLIPVTPVKAGQPSLFERLFENNGISGWGGFTFHHASFNINNPDDTTVDKNTPGLLAGLCVSQTELLYLLQFLKNELQINNSGNFTMDRRKISLLYRHAMLARALKISLEDLLHIFELNIQPPDTFVSKLEHVAKLVDFLDWLKTTPLTLADLQFILKDQPVETPSPITALVEKIQQDKALYFDGQLLARVEGVTEENSEDIVNQMARGGLLAASADGKLFRLDTAYKLSQDFKGLFEAIAATDSVRAKEDEIRKCFNSYHPQAVLPPYLAALFSISQELLDTRCPFSKTDRADSAFITALTASIIDGTPARPQELAVLKQFVQEIKWLLLIEKLKLKEADLAFISGQPNIFKITGFQQFTLDTVRLICLYQKLPGLREDTRTAVHKLLTSYRDNAFFTRNDATLLSGMTEKEQALIQSVAGGIELPANPLEAVQQLTGALEICSLLGINGPSLKQLTRTGFTELQEARDTLFAAFRAKYDDPAAWQKVMEPYEEQINMKKRDALCNYILAGETQLKFKDCNDLYSFFLIDVEMSGCARVSRVVAANSSLQLYVHRCLVNLEQSADGTVKVLPSLIPAKEWEWRKNYRVWEANRKVFVYPENYIEPELRDNKSPLFRELEDELLQQKITAESAENAYIKYLAQFAEAARLKIAGSYYHRWTGTLYLFGRTATDPPQYHLRKFIAGRREWTPWEKIELSVNADNVSAAVFRGRLYLFWVEISTQKNVEVENGTQKLKNYTNNIYLHYSYLNESGKWIPPQRLDFQSFTAYEEENLKQQSHFEAGPYRKKLYPSVTEEYGIVTGYWYYVLPTYTIVIQKKLDLYHNKMAYGYDPNDFAYDRIIRLYQSGSEAALGIYYDAFLRNDPFLDAKLPTDKKDDLALVTNLFDRNLFKPNVTIVHNKFGNFIVKLGEQQFLIHKAEGFILPQREFIRLTTSLPDRLGEILADDGLEAFLSLDTQKMKEEPLGIEFTSPAELMPVDEDEDRLPFDGPYGIYFQELFFHIPALIANHLNANQKFAEAGKWYEKIFNPTASEDPEPARPADRNWRYLMFRNLGIEKMREILSDQAAIERYKEDPFNPHAIARLRLSAYQKAIVMKYIDNLLDWGDDLFARDTIESINEATMLYVLAADILGQRPVKLGKCQSAPAAQMTYNMIGPAIKYGSEFAISLENWTYSTMVNRNMAKEDKAALKTYKKSGSAGHYQAAVIAAKEEAGAKNVYEGIFHDFADTEFPHDVADLTLSYNGPVFCVPANETLLAYWDRVEDRLFKIRHCLNIKGIRRQLALFEPPINPAALVKARAAGLSLDDILASLYDALPPYRFTYLIEKAKSLAAAVQGFGSALLSALEKKDVEELTLLRSVHEQNILKLTREVKKKQINEARAQLESLYAARINVENRKSHYDSLIETGLTRWETTQQAAKHLSTGLQIVGNIFFGAAPILYLIPQLGCPFSMKYGGKEMGDSSKAWGEFLNKLAAISEAVASSAGLEAGFQRREEEWKLEQKLAGQDLVQMDRQIAAAGLRVEISEKDLEVHETGIEQSREVYDFYKNKFTNLGLYNYLATSLCRLHREAYNLACDTARMAEHAYRFERDDDTVFIENDNWQTDRAGLLAGERLLLQLHRMEKSFLETNVRDYEITQSFSMRLLNPDALVQLKETGVCDEFKIPEIFFDFFYPGQYRRLIKSVRLTIPCVTGPYTNVSCKLTLKNSQVRKEPKPDAQYLLDVPARRLTSVATSSANNDGGVFELNFRDERYMPFEGAGAVSAWGLELPRFFRPFDYRTISDVIFHISYTAKDDGLFRQNVEDGMKQQLLDFAAQTGLFRLFSLKHDFPNQWHQLLNPAGAVQETTLNLQKDHFPYILRDQTLQIAGVTLFLQPKEGSTLDTGSLSLKARGAVAGPWTDAQGDLRKAPVSLTGNPIGEWTVSAEANGLAKDGVEDLLILLKYGAVC